MALDPRLTIVMPLKGRPHFTIRWLVYANRINFPYKIIFADGSEEADADLVSAVLQDKTRFPNIDYEYIRFPFDQTFNDYFIKMRDSLQRVSSPFAALADNDDFPILEGIQKCLTFLNSNPDYIACGGAIGQLMLSPSDRFKNLEGVLSDRLWWQSLGNGRHDLAECHATERIARHLGSYAVTHYDIHKTQVIQKMFTSLAASDLKDIFMAELYTSVMAAATGKMKGLPELFLIRQIGVIGSGAALDALVRGDSYDRMLRPNWSSDFNCFLDNVAKILVENDGVALDQAKDTVKTAYRSYSASVLPKLLARSSSTFKISLRHKLSNAPIFKGLKNIYMQRKIAKSQLEMAQLSSHTPSLRAIEEVLAEKDQFIKILSRCGNVYGK